MSGCSALKMDEDQIQSKSNSQNGAQGQEETGRKGTDVLLHPGK